MTDDEVRGLKLDGWPLPDDYLRELGRVAALWAELESFVNMCIGKLAGFNELNDPKPFILVTHASFPQRLDMLGSLCEELASDFPHLKDAKTVLGLLRSAQTARNRFVHHTMGVNQDTGKAQMAIGSARGILKVAVEDIDLADIRRAAMTIHEAMLALYKLVLRRAIAPVWERRPGSE